MTLSTICGYCSGMPLLVFDVTKGMWFWEVVVGSTFEDGTRRIVTHRYQSGLPMYDNFGGELIPYLNYYLEPSLNYLSCKDKLVYRAYKGEVPSIVYYLN